MRISENEQNLANKKAILTQMKLQYEELLRKKEELDTVPESGDIGEILAYGQKVASELPATTAQIEAFSTAISSISLQVQELENLVAAEKRTASAEEAMNQIRSQAQNCIEAIENLETEICQLKTLTNKHYSVCFNLNSVPPLEITNDVKLPKIEIFTKKIKISYDMNLKLKIERLASISE